MDAEEARRMTVYTCRILACLGLRATKLDRGSAAGIASRALSMDEIRDVIDQVAQEQIPNFELILDIDSSFDEEGNYIDDDEAHS